MENIKKDRKFGIGALLLGLLAIATCMVQALAIIFAGAAIILATLQIRKKHSYGFAVAGLELAAIGFAYSFIVKTLIVAVNQLF